MVLAVPFFDSARKMFAHVVAHVVECGPVRVAPGHAVLDKGFQVVNFIRVIGRLFNPSLLKNTLCLDALFVHKPVLLVVFSLELFLLLLQPLLFPLFGRHFIVVCVGLYDRGVRMYRKP